MSSTALLPSITPDGAVGHACAGVFVWRMLGELRAPRGTAHVKHANSFAPRGGAPVNTGENSNRCGVLYTVAETSAVPNITSSDVHAKTSNSVLGTSIGNTDVEPKKALTPLNAPRANERFPLDLAEHDLDVLRQAAKRRSEANG